MKRTRSIIWFLAALIVLTAGVAAVLSPESSKLILLAETGDKKGDGK
jgi:hypothetical protein